MPKVIRQVWIPESFEEFRKAAIEGRVSVDYNEKQESWLYKYALPYVPGYRDKLVQAIVNDRLLYEKVVLKYMVDLTLYEDRVNDIRTTTPIWLRVIRWLERRAKKDGR